MHRAWSIHSDTWLWTLRSKVAQVSLFSARSSSPGREVPSTYMYCAHEIHVRYGTDALLFLHDTFRGTCPGLLPHHGALVVRKRKCTESSPTRDLSGRSGDRAVADRPAQLGTLRLACCGSQPCNPTVTRAQVPAMARASPLKIRGRQLSRSSDVRVCKTHGWQTGSTKRPRSVEAR